MLFYFFSNYNMKTIAVLLGLLVLASFGSAKPTINTDQREMLTQLYESLDQKKVVLGEKVTELKSSSLTFEGGKGKKLFCSLSSIIEKF